MPDAKTLHCDLLTPDQAVLECDALSVSLPAHDGEFGFLKNRAPLLCKLGAGELRIDAVDAEHRYFLDGGFAEMSANRLTILTQHAEPADKIDPTEADKALHDALALPTTDPPSRQSKSAAVTRARARKRLARASNR